MKKILTVCMLPVLAILSLSAASTGADVAPPPLRKGAVVKLAIFPFFNLTGSSAGYLEWYLPELVGRSLPASSRIEILDPRRIAAEMKMRDITARDLYQGDAALSFAKELGATVAVAGRFLHEGKSLRVSCRVVKVAGGGVAGSDEYSGTVEDNLLDVAAACASRAADWITIEAFPEIATGIHAERLSPLRDMYARLRESPAGIVFRNKWLFSLFIITGFYLLSLFVRMLIERVMKALSARTATTVDDDIVMVARKPLRWMIIILGFKLALLPPGFPAAVYTVVNNALTSVMIALAGYFTLKVAEILLKAWGRGVAQKLNSRINDDLVPLFSRMIRVFIVIITALLVLAKFGIEIGPLIASLGIAGFAIGFAVKDTLSNIIGGIILTLDSSFAVGDKVNIDGDVGVVKEVGLRNTQLLTYDNEVVIIPNGELMNKKFKNFALPNPEIRVIVDFGVAYGSDVDKVEKTVLDAIHGVSEVKAEPAPEVIFVSMGDFSLNFQARFWIPMCGSQLGKKVEATKRIYRALVESGIDIPFPTRTVHLMRE
ncbi:MAG: mechanosensitive ion channel family protein [Spirochaetes bacterium]|nr:mechanosensitive ion channel family protein [Spirochaetota bacterium]